MAPGDNDAQTAALAQQLRARALKLLAQREHSQAELSRKLARSPSSTTRRKRGGSVSPNEETPQPITNLSIPAAQIIDQLKAAGYQSDERFAQSTVRRLGEQVSERVLREKLKQAGIDKDTSDAAVTERDSKDDQVAQALWLRKFGVAPRDDKDKARQIRFYSRADFRFQLF